MPNSLTLGGATTRPGPPNDPLSVILNSSEANLRTVSIRSPRDGRVHQVHAVLDMSAPSSTIPEALVGRLGLQKLPSTPSAIRRPMDTPAGIIRAPREIVRVFVVDSIESCGIPDVELWMGVSPDTVPSGGVTPRHLGEVLYIGRNALEKAANQRRG
ncbi:uncharacterized protein DNG_07609 [Cephalotrichum gorgonifer]|uniref:Uncharacterized protein n=1 Tax=Cephalotrichum gorgonifer TaxID=2041049 RepID=A0AAE8N3M5_9PEZI|nr:uncharacterized protein DNG_07609 [Cephalotrichum gorgonifer]